LIVFMLSSSFGVRRLPAAGLYTAALHQHVHS